MKLKIQTAIVLLLTFFTISISHSSTLGNNITIQDQNSNNRNWHRAGEDNEVEPGMEHGQYWDMEAFYLLGNTLSMVGGFDFISGRNGITAGDIFIDVTGDAVFGDIHKGPKGNRTIQNSFGYDYVIDLNFSALRYDIYRIDETALVKKPYYKANYGSGPWQYESGGELLESQTFEYVSGVQDNESQYQLGLLGGYHNIVTGIDLSFLGNGWSEALIHSTMGCGNDNLMGYTVAPVPEPSTMLLLGFGLLGLAQFQRKNQGRSTDRHGNS